MALRAWGWEAQLSRSCECRQSPEELQVPTAAGGT